jgi:three-Cys-motif partner protein
MKSDIKNEKVVGIMAAVKFFEESREQSEVKAAIVTRYFWAWSKVMIPQAKKHAGKIAYIDLFAGPGRYKDGTKSTPLLLLEQAIQDPDMCRMLVTLFNDANQDFSQSLERALLSLPGIENLTYPPKVHNFEVGEEIARQFQEMSLVPTLFFVDPWGYKGLSLNLIGSVLKNWGCDCIFFFNYNRINMGLSNDLVCQHMNALFGSKRADRLRERLETMSSYERELAIVEELGEALEEMGGKYVLPFRFVDSRGSRTSHHLIFVSKHVLGYEIMKDIMAKESSRTEQGVPTLEYNPADARYPMLFELSKPLDELAEMLLNEFSGQTLTMKDIYRNHHVGRRFIKRNYKEVLRQLEAEGQIIAIPSANERPKRKGEVTFADHVKAVFP